MGDGSPDSLPDRSVVPATIWMVIPLTVCVRQHPGPESPLDRWFLLASAASS